MMDKATVLQILNATHDERYRLVDEAPIPNGTGISLRLQNGCIVNCFDTGSHNVQGKDTQAIKELLNNPSPHQTAAQRNIFVVYGHDNIAKTSLEAMLRRWNITPIILDQIESQGSTIIEKLEESISQANFGIVLATPDDFGYPKEKPDEGQYRARQNVVLELGMLLAALGRRRVAILLNDAEEMEKPSDIDGLIYIPFKDSVEETQIDLAKELYNSGIEVSVAQI